MRRTPSIDLVRCLAHGVCPASAAVLLLVSAAPARAQVVPTGFADSTIAAGIDYPCALEFTPDGRVLFTMQMTGDVRILTRDSLLAAPVLTVPNIINTGEQGLLGIALDPRFPAKPYLYTHETVNGHFIHITRWTLTGDLAGTGDGHMASDPASAFELLSDIPNQASNHNGGTVRFGPDSMLYVSIGDDATGCGAQDPTTLEGEILRLDVRQLPPGPGAAFRAQITPADNPYVAVADSNQRLVYAYGLRNPFRFQVDPVRNWLVIGEVGELTYEEMDLLAMPGATPGAAPAGSNFGWPWREGFAPFTTCGPTEPVAIAPIFVLDRTALGNTAIISAGAYHPTAGDTASWPAEYVGDVFFANYYSGDFWRLKQQGSTWSIAPAVSGQSDPNLWATGLPHPSDFRIGPDGALWYTSQSSLNFQGKGSIHRIAWTGSQVPPPPPISGAVVHLTARPLPARVPVVLSYTLPAVLVARLRVYDTRGRLVRQLLPATEQAATSYDFTWDGMSDDGRKMPAGIYWARLEAGSEYSTVKLPLLR